MKLLEQVKRLRVEFPDIKIRQTLDYLNRKCAVFMLPSCSENITLCFEYDFIILDFYGVKSVYGYSEKDFQYLISELHGLIDCRLLILAVECGGTFCGGFMASEDSINTNFINQYVLRVCREKFGDKLPKSAFVNLYYCNTELDRCEYCDFRKMKI